MALRSCRSPSQFWLHIRTIDHLQGFCFRDIFLPCRNDAVNFRKEIEMSYLNTAIELAQNGVASADIALAVARVSMGAFFACSGFNKLTNKARHEAMTETLRADHVPAIGFNQWWVPGWEFVGGAMLIAGVFSAFAASVLLIICAVACMAEGRARVDAYKPINEADRVADWLYLPEVLYMIALAAVALAGGGAFAIDRIL
jgi:uncharacterized membrane protein YphA (DoxX/SURF4 family)